MKKKAFTIIELLVAMALLAMMVAISAMVFSSAVKAYRTSNATTEIMARMRNLTEQLDTDFRGLRKDLPVAIWFEYDPATGKRYDQIQFFADGDFYSTKQWGSPADELHYNAARVYYGQANQTRINPSTLVRTPPGVMYNHAYPDTSMGRQQRGVEAILARRVHLLGQFPPIPATAAANLATYFLPWGVNPPFPPFNAIFNDRYEFDQATLSEWGAILSDTAQINAYVDTCFNNATGRPQVDLTALDGESTHMVFIQGLGSFSIQFDEVIGGDLVWVPRAGDFPAADTRFGYYCYKTNDFVWCTDFSSNVVADTDGDGVKDWNLDNTGCDKALKFTFTIYDSKGIFPDGKTFTHIVYLK